MDQELKWGILSTGAIARAFAIGLGQSRTGRLVAVGSRGDDTADAFGTDFGIPPAGRHGSYESLLDDANVEAVYVATPHPFHPEWAIKAAEAGKHVLCEKPFALNCPHATAMFEAAREQGVFMMEAFMYRCHPQVARLLEIIAAGELGEVKVIQAAFAFAGGSDLDSRLLNNALGGGGILDVGGYPISLCRLVAGAANGMPFCEPVEVAGVGHVGTTGVDEYAAAVLKFPGDVIAEVATGVLLGMDNVARIYGTEGWILVQSPWAASRQDPQEGVMLVNAGGNTREVRVPAECTSFGYEADVVAEAVFAGRQQPSAPAMTWDDTLGNMRALDRWRECLGVVYEAEKPEHCRTTVANRELRVGAGHNMRYGHVPGLDKQVSRFVMGVDNQGSFPHAQVLFDAWYECGGNAFDTSWVYGAGTQEILLGQWIRARGVRDDLVIVVKGAHTPRCTPELLLADFHTSLERLQLERADLYVMHRDNPDVPAGEFVDVLNDLREQGLVAAFGGSNWTIERFEEANEYARDSGKQGMALLSNNLSLARMVRPVWDGCLHVSDAQSRRRLQQRQTVVFAWSSQARGYFLPEAQWKKLGEDDFACWDAPDNLQRRERAFELAVRRGVSAINIAAAYVLCQPFPVFALIGPREVHELTTSLPALDIDLSPAELAYLDLDSEALPPELTDAL